MEFTLFSLLHVVISKMLLWVYKRYTTNLLLCQGVLGFVCGIRIHKPSENEADYVNRHFYHSINVQAICQPDGRFRDVLVRFPRPFTILLRGSYHRL